MIQLSHVPSFEEGGTYVVSAYVNDHLYASPVVGTEQGMFREVIEEASGETLLVDIEGRRLERDGSGRLRRGRHSEPGSLPGIVRLVSDGTRALGARKQVRSSCRNRSTAMPRETSSRRLPRGWPGRGTRPRSASTGRR
ncbi:MAG: hypothetical protein IPF66_07145 [Holophagales bacterium]|nr:hypothetical protein [Holophagales bacterium]